MNLNKPKILAFLALCLIAVISFATTMLSSHHYGVEYSFAEWIDISFYFWIPVLTGVGWIVGVSHIAKYVVNKITRRKFLFYFLILGAILSPLMRTIDIFLDYSLKYLLGLSSDYPWSIVNEVWFLILSSSPEAFVRLAVVFMILLLSMDKKYQDESIRVVQGKKQVMLPLQEVQFFSSEGNYIQVHTLESSYRMRKTLRELESKLASNFLRIHRSHIVNTQHIRCLEHWRNGEYLVTMDNGAHLSSSQSFKTNVSKYRNSPPLK